MRAHFGNKARRGLLGLLAAAQIFVAAPAVAEPKCDVPQNILRFEYALPELAKQPEIRIVALGASSTEGYGATSLQAAYPNRLELELKRLFPGKEITVYNKGKSGELVTDMHRRFDEDVMALKPDLLIWQIGTNEVMDERPFAEMANLVDGDLKKAHTAGIKIILMDLQYAKKLEKKPGVAEMETLIATMARNENANLYKRYESMKFWVKEYNQPLDMFLFKDDFHLNNNGYVCIARNLGNAIFDAVTRPDQAAAIAPSTKSMQ
jgi:lysophospholipase L1-like esterase